MFVYVFVKDGNINDILFVLQTCIFLFFFISACADYRKMRLVVYF